MQTRQMVASHADEGCRSGNVRRRLCRLESAAVQLAGQRAAWHTVAAAACACWPGQLAWILAVPLEWTVVAAAVTAAVPLAAVVMFAAGCRGTLGNDRGR